MMKVSKIIRAANQFDETTPKKDFALHNFHSYIFKNSG